MLQRGFTLIELLVVVSIISLISSIMVTSIVHTRSLARDSIRIQAMRNLQQALEAYKTDNGFYPSTQGRAGCESVGWTLDCGEDRFNGNYGYDGNGYIPNLVPAYINALPADPFKNQKVGQCRVFPNYAGFHYMSDGNTYILDDVCTLENPVTTTSPFFYSGQPTYLQAKSPGS